MAQPKSTLSSVVSNLVRASMGTSVSTTVSDEDLDRHVAELILKEAKQKAEKYGSEGIRAYLPQAGRSDSNVPRTNKRFLSSIIRSTDDHNKTILRAQAEAAEEIRHERREQEKQERRMRAEEATAAERMRRLMGTSGSTRWASNWEKGDRKEGKKRARSWERRDEDHGDHERSERRSEKRHRRRSRSRSEDRRHRSEKSSGRHRDRDGESRHRSRSPETEEDREARRRRRREEERRRSTSADERRHKRHRRDEDYRSRSRSRPQSPHRDNDRSSHRKRRLEEDRKERIPSDTTSKSPTPGPQPASPIHFALEDWQTSVTGPSTPSPHDSGYAEPRASASTLPAARSSSLLSTTQRVSRKASAEPSSHRSGPVSTRSPSPPSSRRERERERRRLRSRPRSPSSSPPPLPPHLLPSKMDKYFEESYDPRLDVAPLAVPTVPKTGLISDTEFAGWDAMLELIKLRREDKAERKRLERLGMDPDNFAKLQTTSSSSSGAIDIMDIEYKKRGSVREWDLGKEGF